jgi:hypothetical protein
VDVPPSRVVLIDLGASLGGLTGAAVAAPVLFVDERASKNRNRVWLSAIAGGMLVGGAVSAWMTRNYASSPHTAPQASVALPFAGVIGESTGPSGSGVPVVGGGLAGTW